MKFTCNITIRATEDRCVFESNAVPNHDFNDGATSFRNDVTEQSINISITRNPTIATKITPLALGLDNAIFLNGVKLDLLAAACYGVGNQPLGKEKIGCGDRDISNPWRYDPLSPFNNFGTDSNHAHAQPDGTYHYHAGPQTLFNTDCDTEGSASPVIGFAADGYPIYGPCLTTDAGIRKLKSSYVLRDGVRQPQAGYMSIGFNYLDFWPHIAGATVAGFIGTWLGKRVSRRISEKVFRHVFRMLVSLIAIRLIYKGWLG